MANEPLHPDAVTRIDDYLRRKALKALLAGAVVCGAFLAWVQSQANSAVALASIAAVLKAESVAGARVEQLMAPMTSKVNERLLAFGQRIERAGDEVADLNKQVKAAGTETTKSIQTYTTLMPS